MNNPPRGEVCLRNVIAVAIALVMKKKNRPMYVCAYHPIRHCPDELVHRYRSRRSRARKEPVSRVWNRCRILPVRVTGPSPPTYRSPNTWLAKRDPAFPDRRHLRNEHKRRQRPGGGVGGAGKPRPFYSVRTAPR